LRRAGEWITYINATFFDITLENCQSLIIRNDSAKDRITKISLVEKVISATPAAGQVGMDRKNIFSRNQPPFRARRQTFEG